MSLPNANVLGNPATTTVTFQNGIEELRQHVADLSFVDVAGVATAAQVPGLDSLNGTLSISKTYGDLPVSRVGWLTQESGHTRIGNMQLWNGASALSLLQVTRGSGNYTIGPTGSGKDHIWSVLDSLPSDAKALILYYELEVNANATNDCEAWLVTSVTDTLQAGNYVAQVTGRAGEVQRERGMIIQPISTAQSFRTDLDTYDSHDSVTVKWRYGGFITE